MSATTKMEQGMEVSAVDYVICQGPSADGLWAEFRIGGTVGFTAVKRGKGKSYPRLQITVRVTTLKWTSYRDRFFFEGELIALSRKQNEVVDVARSGFYVVGCYEMSSRSGWIEAKRGRIPV